MRPSNGLLGFMAVIEKLLSLQPTYSKKSQKPQTNWKFVFTAIENDVLKVIFPPYSIISKDFLVALDKGVAQNTKLPSKLLIITNGILDAQDCALPYLLESSHSDRYKAVAFVQNVKGDMGILETHFLRTFFQNGRVSNYPKSIFTNELEAQDWLKPF